MEKDKLIIFMHIPKTGGTTLNDIFHRQYKDHELYNHEALEGRIIKPNQLNAEDKRKIKAVSGHYLYGVHSHFPSPFEYFTMLRNPIDRVISLYYFLRNYKGYERVKDMTLEEYVIKEAEAHNFQTIMASGIPINPDLEKAKQNLKTFGVVGITELFDESLFILKKEYGWNNIHYTKQNITKKKLSKEDIPPSIINLIKEHNKLDIELYDFAKKLLNQRLNSLTIAEQQQLNAFKEKQRLLS